MLMRWYGYGCFAFSDDNVRVIIDPHDGRSIGIFPPSTDADIVICTHNTYTRNCFRSIRGIHTDVMMPEGEAETKGFAYEGLRTQSIYGDGMNSAIRFTMDDIDIVVCGCIGDLPEEEVIEKMKGAHILVIPVGEYETMPMDKVNRLIELVGAPIIVPSEFKAGGITIPLSNMQTFSQGRNQDDFAYVGSEAEFTLEDIEEYSGVWIFDF